MTQMLKWMECAAPTGSVDVVESAIEVVTTGLPVVTTGGSLHGATSVQHQHHTHRRITHLQKWKSP
jgi:hypothetical protein